jgi:hypothetical protein
VVTDSLTSVVAVVPSGATTGPVTVQTPGGTASSAKPFTPSPVITSFTPGSGPPGSSVTVVGTGLGGVTKVTVAGKRASITSTSPTLFVLVVPARATSGPIHVTTHGGSAVSTATFHVT